MKIGWAFIIVVSCLGLGCRRDPYLDLYVESLNAEKRTLEDEIYELQFDYEAMAQELEACRQERQAGRERASRVKEAEPQRRSILPTRPEGTRSRDQNPPASSESSSAGSNESGDPVPSSRAPSSIRSNRPELTDDVDLAPPQIDPGTPPEDAGEVPPKKKSAEDGGPSVLRKGQPPESSGVSPKMNIESPVSSIAPNTVSSSQAPGDSWVTQIVINAARSGGADFDDRPGDDGIVIVVEPRNAVGEFVPQAAPFSLVAIDPQLSGEEARIAKWEFDSEQVEQAAIPDKKGFLLKGAWNNRRPTNSLLRVFVRYYAIDGRHLDAQRDVPVSITEGAPERWTPRGSANTSRETAESPAIGNSSDSESLPPPVKPFDQTPNVPTPNPPIPNNVQPSEERDSEPETLELPPPKRTATKPYGRPANQSPANQSPANQSPANRSPANRSPAKVAPATALEPASQRRLNFWKPFR